MIKRAKEIVKFYRSENAGVLSSIARVINQGRLAGTGMFVILTVDQGFEHGPELHA
jgi:class I fructose-bisphosphate aldolase